MFDLTLVMPYYRNPNMLSLQYQTWSKWPKRLRDRVAIILVDDGTPDLDEAAINVPRPAKLPDLSIYRVLEDRPWHQHAARNLGAHVAEDGWMLMTDMDHVFPELSLEALFRSLDDLHKTTVYMPHRVEADTGLPTMKNGQLKPHPNSFILTRGTYWHIGGYDEDFCGLYGTDSLFRQRVQDRAGIKMLPKVSLVRYWSNIVADASTRDVQRKEGRMIGARERIWAEKIARGERNRIKTLDFPWTQVL